MKKLDCSLLVPGAKFIVNKDVKENTFGPGTIGIMSYIKNADLDYENVAHVVAVIIRRGKGGIQRLNVNSMSIPVFANPKMLEHKNYLPVGRRHYVHIDPFPYKEGDLLKVSALDFLGWSTAYMKYLYYLATSIARPKKSSIIPQDNGHPLAIANRMPDYFDSNRDETLDKFSEEKFRKSFIKISRAAEASLIKCVLMYQKMTTAIALNSANFMKYTNDEYYEVTNKKEAENTITFYEDKLRIIEEMSTFKRGINNNV